MPTIILVDRATERLRDNSLLGLAVVYLLPLVVALPPNINVVLTAALTVFCACLRTVGKTHEAEILSQKVRLQADACGACAAYCVVRDGVLLQVAGPNKLGSTSGHPPALWLQEGASCSDIRATGCHVFRGSTLIFLRLL
jgi:hypothetical protein